MSAFRAERSPERSRAEVARQLGEAMLAALELACAGFAAAPTAPTPSAEPLQFLDLDEVGRRIGLSRSSVEALVGRAFTPVKQGRALRVPSTEVLAYQQRLIREAGNELPGESPSPIDIGRSRRSPAAPSAASAPHRAAHRKARQSR